MIRLAARNASLIDDVRRFTAPLWTPQQRLRALANRNTRSASRRHIAAHYDLGEQLFERMLDPTMMYSCALFEHSGMTLEEASVAKLERVCEQLQLGPERSPDRDRHRLGRPRGARRRDARLPGYHDHDLRASARLCRGACP